MALTNLCCIDKDSGTVECKAASAGKFFTDVFRSVLPPFRIKHFDESDFEKTEFEDGHVVAQLVEALCYEPEGR
jgi:hypothetical protein